MISGAGQEGATRGFLCNTRVALIPRFRNSDKRPDIDKPASHLGTCAMMQSPNKIFSKFMYTS